VQEEVEMEDGEEPEEGQMVQMVWEVEEVVIISHFCLRGMADMDA
jgi:hypothetical protein